MINFRLLYWFIEYVVYFYGKGSFHEFDEKVSDIMNMIWELRKDYSLMTKDIPF